MGTGAEGGDVTRPATATNGNHSPLCKSVEGIKYGFGFEYLTVCILPNKAFKQLHFSFDP